MPSWHTSVRSDNLQDPAVDPRVWEAVSAVTIMFVPDTSISCNPRMLLVRGRLRYTYYYSAASPLYRVDRGAPTSDSLRARPRASNSGPGRMERQHPGSTPPAAVPLESAFINCLQWRPRVYSGASPAGEELGDADAEGREGQACYY